jgi:hypothetical protein
MPRRVRHDAALERPGAGIVSLKNKNDEHETWRREGPSRPQALAQVCPKFPATRRQAELYQNHCGAA